VEKENVSYLLYHLDLSNEKVLKAFEDLFKITTEMGSSKADHFRETFSK